MTLQSFIEEVKKAIRTTGNAFDSEIEELIESAQLELIQSGVSSEKANDLDDRLIQRAIKTYAKAEFGLDNPNAERFRQSFEGLRQHLSMSGDYNGELGSSS